MVIPCFDDLGNSALVHAAEMIPIRNVLRYGHFLNGINMIWSNEHGDARLHVIITFVSSLYEVGSRLKF